MKVIRIFVIIFIILPIKVFTTLADDPVQVHLFKSNIPPDQIAEKEFIPFYGMELLIQHRIKHTVFAVQIKGNQNNQDKNDDWIPLGTGFFMRVEGIGICGFTCRHVIQRAVQAKKQIYMGIDTDQGYSRFKCKPIYIDPKYDIAVLHHGREGEEIIRTLHYCYTPDVIGESNSLLEGRAVVIPGYPLGLGIQEDQNHPVIRMGIIAQYAGKDTFLIDGITSPGNSGSPVYLLKTQRLIGMIIAYEADHISLMDTQGRIAAKLPYNSGIAKSLTGEIIAEVVKRIPNIK